MSDGDDVMMTRCRADDIVHAYNELNKTIVFNSESWCWPDGHRWFEFPEVPKPPLSSDGVVSPYRYLNAGAVIGTAAALRQFLAEAYALESSDCADDQRALAANFINHYRRSSSAENMSVTLDYYQRLFMTLQGHTLADFHVDTIRGSVRNRLLNSSSCILHQNGWKGDSMVLEEVASLLKVDEW
ncbi:Procollagen-lysine,2-oxoglutarate 5-dioxygenase 2 [Gaertneriomyces sp. JEL0708]|nr:Procollagen-lysine,2-oxoglutarate 5-dioxygenase 2 [Gaertneriomyces sp. JEL0708]